MILREGYKLPTDENSTTTHRIRIVRVSPSSATSSGSDDDKNNNYNMQTVRPNEDYFSRTGGKKAKEKAGFVSSVDWTKTLDCYKNDGRTAIKSFPKRPDLL